MKRSLRVKVLAFAMTFILVFSQCAAVFAEDGGLPKRSEIPDQYKWNLSDFYKDQAAWEKDFNKILNEYVPKLLKFKGKLTSSKNVLDCFKLDDEMNRMLEKVYVYAGLCSDLDNADSKASELLSRAETLNSKVMEAEAFIEPELLSKPEKTIKGYMNSAAFKDYKYYFDRLLKKKAHTLSKSEEGILAMASDFASTPNDIYSKASTADLKLPMVKDENGADVQLTRGKYSAFLESPNREVRKGAFEGMFGAYKNVGNTLASTISAEVKKNIFFAKARKYNSALEASLAQNYIPASVYDNLVKAVNNNVGSLHKYVALRKKVLGIDNVHFYDMYVPLVDNYTMEIKYEDGKKMVLDGLKPLGQEYVDAVAKAFESKWIDVYETENKYSGAYNWGTYDTHPYLLLNYNDTADAMLTLSHEMGHAMHAYYSNKTQPYATADAPIFTAEVASTTNELIMTEYLLSKAKNNEEKLYLLNALIENIRGSVYTQIMYAEFEKTIHERVEKGEALSLDSLNGIWKSLMEKYYGKDFVVDDLAAQWWSRIPHFYMNFYVYQYATGMAAAYPLSQSLVKGEKGAQERYLQFLKNGSSDYPVEILKKAGVDMLSTKPVDQVLAEFDRLVGEMEKILIEEGKIQK